MLHISWHSSCELTCQTRRVHPDAFLDNLRCWPFSIRKCSLFNSCDRFRCPRVLWMQASARQRSQGIHVVVDLKDNITCLHRDVLNGTLPAFVLYSQLGCLGNTELCSQSANMASIFKQSLNAGACKAEESRRQRAGRF
jgi:hypothetical protein